MQKLVLPDLPVYTARFAGRKQLLISGNRRHFYFYDMDGARLEKVAGIQSTVMGDYNNLSRLCLPADNSEDYFAFAGGEQGTIALLSQKTKRLVKELKMSGGSCSSIAMSGSKIFAVGDQAEVHVWDVRMTSKLLDKFSDEGSFNSTHIALSPDGQYLATGSHSGIVNIYRTASHEHLKSIMNLTTAISDLAFDPSSQLLAACSKWKKNALRLIHLGSCTAYQNFPAGHAVGVLKYPLCLAFSEQYLAMGNDEGKAHLWTL